jgi:hypothetical protein
VGCRLFTIVRNVEGSDTWRDGLGRLVWGVNDFDEVCSLQCPDDPVGLTVGTRLAMEGNPSSFAAVGASETILAGYKAALPKEGQRCS